MSSDNVAIRAENLSKCYQIYNNPSDRLKQMIFPRLRRLFGKNHPSMYYKEFWVLKDISFEIKKGETVGIIGANGAGKSTLLQIICGTLSPTSGEVEIEGRLAALLELGSGFNPEFTGRENVFLNGSLLGLEKHEIEERFNDIAGFADIGDFIEQPVKTYSSGMLVRLAFAVIAHVDADILIIDEALSVGDAFFVQKCMRFLRNFMKHGTILFVSHDTAAVVNLCSWASWLQKGVVKLTGSPKEVSEAYLAALYQDQQGENPEILDDHCNVIEEHEADYKDMRLEYINSTNLRNDIEVIKFHPDTKSFGEGKATIISVALVDDTGSLISWIVGGENVVLRVKCKAHKDLFSPIVGFFVKDRLGQTLFGDNTFITYQSEPITVVSGQAFSARFSFNMPVLPIGDYSICAAVAEGTQYHHVQHHWLHDALVFRSHSSSLCQGLIGIPMKQIKMSVI
jgi:lipopolysaccharide transport system ATP-binding protein